GQAVGFQAMLLGDRRSETVLGRGQKFYKPPGWISRAFGARPAGADQRLWKRGWAENAEWKGSGHSGNADFELRLIKFFYMCDYPNPEFRTESGFPFVDSHFL